MYPIGQRLREERLRKGAKLSDISEFTRIHSAFLEAIENEQFDQLPGKFYARSFIRQYARYLGVEDAELEAEIKRRLGEPGPVVSAQEVLAGLSVSGPEKSPVLWRTHPASRRLAYATVVLLVLAAILGIYLGWRQARARAEQELRAMKGPEVAASPVAAGNQESEAPGGSVSTGPGVPQSETSVSTPASSAPPPASGESASKQAPLVVQVSAQRASWIQVRTDGKIAFADTLQPGQSRVFEASERIGILTGNAGGLRIVRNGLPLSPIGPEGQIRTIELTPEGYTILPPKPKAAPAEPGSSTGAPGGETPAPLPFNPQ